MLEGKGGNDYLEPWIGNDTLIGGSGDDIFMIRLYATRQNGQFRDGIIYIKDYEIGDKIYITKDEQKFTPFDSSKLSYNSSTGELSFDDQVIVIVENKPENPDFLYVNNIDAEPPDDQRQEVEIETSEGNSTIIAKFGFYRIIAIENQDNSDLLPTYTINDQFLENPSNGDDIIIGGYGSNQIAGGEGDDYIEGGRGSNYLYGGYTDNLQVENPDNNTGNDTIIGGYGENFLFGEDGDDILKVYSSTTSTLILPEFGEIIRDAYLDGGTGNDNLEGYIGDDILFGNLGSDTLTGGIGADSFRISISNSNYVTITDFKQLEDDRLFVIAPIELDVTGASFTLTEAINEGINGLWLKYSDQNIAFLNNLNLSSFNKTQDLFIVELSGNDGDWYANRIQSQSSNDNNIDLNGWWGKDSLIGDDKDNSLFGFYGNDTLNGGGGDDLIYGGGKNNEGNSPLDGTDDNDNDSLSGNNGNDVLYGGAGNDTLLGGSDNDYLDGGVGNDVLYGEAGDDILYGGLGSDTMTGDADRDTFWVSIFDDAIDIIIDYQHGIDNKIQVWVDEINTISQFSLGISGDDLQIQYGGETIATLTEQSGLSTLGVGDLLQLNSDSPGGSRSRRG